MKDYPCMQRCANLFNFMPIPHFPNPTVFFCQRHGRRYRDIGARSASPDLSGSLCLSVFCVQVSSFEVPCCTVVWVLRRTAWSPCECVHLWLYSNYAGWAQGDCFPSVPVCSCDVEWHLCLRSVPRRSRGEGVMQVWGGGGTLFLSDYTVVLAAACCRFQLLLLLPRASRHLHVQTYVLQWDDQAFVY